MSIFCKNGLLTLEWAYVRISVHNINIVEPSVLVRERNSHSCQSLFYVIVIDKTNRNCKNRLFAEK